jgi:hypothetical protein
MRKLVLTATLAALSITAIPAAADPPPWAPAHGRRAHEAQAQQRYYDGGRYDAPRYATVDRYDEVITRRDRVWRGDDGRYYCRRGNGTVGLVVGGALGALVGRQVDGGRDRTLGTVLGATGGALLGREISRGGLRCR